MNPRHLASIAWLQWRILANQFRKQSLLIRIATIIAVVAGIGFTCSTVIGLAGYGQMFLPSEFPEWLFFAWTATAVALAGFSALSMLTELQQTELLSIQKFLHLPVSLNGILTLNYLGSLLSPNFLLFVPTILVAAVLIAMKYGGWLWLSPLLVLAFLFMLTSFIWAIKGWLGSMLSNPRQRSRFVALTTLGIVGIAMTPALFDSLSSRVTKGSADSSSSYRKAMRELDEQMKNRQISAAEHGTKSAELKENRRLAREAKQAWWGAALRLTTRVVPVGWLPAGIEAASLGKGWQSVLFLVGMTAMGLGSLRYAWFVAIREQTGGVQSPRANDASSESGRRDQGVGIQPVSSQSTDLATENPSASSAAGRNWIESDFRGFNGQAAAVAWTCLRNHSRALEAKLALLWPLAVLAFLAISSASARTVSLTPELRSLAGLGVCFLSMMGAMSLLQNQFGFDRHGFRCFLLMPISERDILLGKNMAILPLALLMGLIGLIGTQLLLGMPWTHFLASFFNLGNLLLTGSLVSNLLSILTPLSVKRGSMQPKNLNLGIVLLQLLLFFLTPLAMVPATSMLGLEWLVSGISGWNQVPFYLMFSVLWFAVAAAVFFPVLRWQGTLLYKRREAILSVVTHFE